MKVVAMTVDYTFHVGDVLTTILLTLLGFGLRKTYVAIVAFLRKAERIDVEVEQHGIIIDQHTDVMTAAGWLKGRTVGHVARPPRRSKRLFEEV